MECNKLHEAHDLYVCLKDQFPNVSKLKFELRIRTRNKWKHVTRRINYGFEYLGFGKVQLASRPWSKNVVDFPVLFEFYTYDINYSLHN